MEKKQISKKYQYDPLNRLVSVTEKDDRTQVYTYDPAGNRTMTTILESGRVLLGIEKPGPEAPEPPVLAAHQRCGNCGSPVVPGMKFCRSCGAAVTAPAASSPAVAPLVCPACGSPNRPGATFCAKCGRKIT